MTTTSTNGTRRDEPAQRSSPRCAEYRDRHGKFRSARPAQGPSPSQLQGHASSPEFWTEYREWRDGVERLGAGASRAVSGTVADMVARYYRSAGWRGLRDSTKAMRRNILERFREEHGDKSFLRLERRHIQAMVDARGPEAGRNFLKLVRALVRVAIAAELRKDDPTVGVTTVRHKTDGFHSWTEEEIAQFEAAHPVDSRARLAFALLLYTGQRRGDVVRMGRQHVRNARLHVTQGKTGRALVIRVHPALDAILATAAPANMTFLVTGQGKPFTPAGFGNWFRDQCNAAGLPQCSAHGLRKAAARRLAEAGCTASEIMAVTGHASLAEAEKYVRAASQVWLADQAMARMSNLPDGLDKSETK